MRGRRSRSGPAGGHSTQRDASTAVFDGFGRGILRTQAVFDGYGRLRRLRPGIFRTQAVFDGFGRI